MALLGVDVTGTDAALRRLAKLGVDLLQAETKGVKAAAMDAISIFRRKVSGEALKVRTNTYRSSITPVPEMSRGSDGSSEARIGVRDGGARAYAALHETGGTIRPKNSKVLAIPVGDALTPAGVSRFKSPRDVEGGFWFRSKAGRLLFGQRSGRDLNVLFVGKDSVTIPARRPLGQTFDEIRPKVPRYVDDEVKRAVAAANG